MLLLQSLVLLPEGVDTVDHGLDKRNLGVSQPVLVGHVVCAAVKATRLSTGSTGLDSELLTPLLESRQTLLGVAGQVNHDGGPHAGTKVGGAGVDVAVSNKHRLGHSEVELIQTMIDGVNTLWEEDKALQKKHGL